MFEQYLKKRLIKQYAKKLPQDLKANYGLHHFYKKDQVDAAINRKRLVQKSANPSNDVCFAYAMFCSEEDFDHKCQKKANTNDYLKLRAEIAHILAVAESVLTFEYLLAESGYSGGVIATTSLVKINDSTTRSIEQIS